MLTGSCLWRYQMKSADLTSSACRREINVAKAERCKLRTIVRSDGAVPIQLFRNTSCVEAKRSKCKELVTWAVRMPV